MHTQTNNKKPTNADILQQYQTEAEDHKTRKIQEKSIKITEERNEMKQLNYQLDQESQTKMQNRQNHINSQKQDYERYMSEKISRKKIGDFRKKTSEIQGTFKIGEDDREFKRKNKDDFESELPLNPTRNTNIPTTPENNQRENAYYENLNSNANILQQNRNRNQGYNIISGQSSMQMGNANDFDRNDSYSNKSYGENRPETPKLKHNIQSKANNPSYNPINHTDNSNYYGSNANITTNANATYNTNQRNITDSNNRNYNIPKSKNFENDYDNLQNKKNLDVNNFKNNNLYNNQRAGNLQYEEDYNNIVSGNANKDLRQESEVNEYSQGEKYNNLTDEKRKKLYEEYMKKYGAKNEHEEDNYNKRAQGKDHEVKLYLCKNLNQNFY